jgi:hypothetical protein
MPEPSTDPLAANVAAKGVRIGILYWLFFASARITSAAFSAIM